MLTSDNVSVAAEDTGQELVAMRTIDENLFAVDDS